MTRAILLATLVLTLSSGCATTKPALTPQQQTHAFQRYVEGATTHEIATEMACEPAQARKAIKQELLAIHRRLHRDR